MIIGQAIQLIYLCFAVSVYASEFDSKSKNMATGMSMTATAIGTTMIDNNLEHEDVKSKLKEIVPFESIKLVIKPIEPKTEDDQLFAFMEIMNIISFICEKALKREDKKTFAENWIGAIFELAKEVYARQVSENSDDEFDHETLKLKIGAEEFDYETLKLKIGAEEFDSDTTLKQSIYDIIFSSPESSDSSSDISLNSDGSNYNDIIQDLDEGTDLFALMKSKMINEEISDEKEDWVSDTGSEYSDYKEDKAEHKQREIFSDDEKQGTLVVVRGSLWGKARRRNRGGIMGRIVNADNINMASDLMVSMTVDSNAESQSEVNEEIIDNEIGVSVPTGIDSAAMMAQMQQQVMEQIMAQLVQSNPQLAQYGTILQDERAKFEAVMGGGGDELPEISREGIIQYLKTSALPKLLNSAIKGKSGIDVLRSFSMILRTLNEGLGIFEVILKMLLRITKAVRYYALCIADVVNDMAREDNMTPIVDLSVSLDSISMGKKSGGKMKKLSSMFRKSRKSASSVNESDLEHEMSPFTMGIHAALCKTRDYTSELQKLPSVLLLSLIHTIFAELNKRNGIIRVALGRKQHKTLIGMQNEINSAVEKIFEAIMMKDEESYSHLQILNPMIITEILISLISPVKMEPMTIDKHIAEVTTWIKPLMVFMNQESQINMLNYLLTDPEVERSFRKSQGASDDKRIRMKNFNWTSSKRLTKQRK